MANIYGISTKKIDNRLNDWVNTYYIVAEAIETAETVAEQLATAEASIHSTLVTIISSHIWQVGTPGTFSNPAYDFPGVISATNALPPWWTAEINLTSSNSYPGYKRYRTRVSRAFYDGPDWNDAYIALLDTFADVFDELPVPLTTRSGVAFTGMALNAIPAPLQLSKAWYNRSS